MELRLALLIAIQTTQDFMVHTLLKTLDLVTK